MLRNCVWAALFALAACKSSVPPPPTAVPDTCSSDAECESNFRCDLQLRRCVCTADSACGGTTPFCNAFTGLCVAQIRGLHLEQRLPAASTATPRCAPASPSPGSARPAPATRSAAPARRARRIPTSRRRGSSACRPAAAAPARRACRARAEAASRPPRARLGLFAVLVGAAGLVLTGCNVSGVTRTPSVARITNDLSQSVRLRLCSSDDCSHGFDPPDETLAPTDSWRVNVSSIGVPNVYLVQRPDGTRLRMPTSGLTRIAAHRDQCPGVRAYRLSRASR